MTRNDFVWALKVGFLIGLVYGLLIVGGYIPIATT